jgi:hypothetical protein
LGYSKNKNGGLTSVLLHISVLSIIEEKEGH